MPCVQCLLPLSLSFASNPFIYTPTLLHYFDTRSSHILTAIRNMAAQHPVHGAVPVAAQHQPGVAHATGAAVTSASGVPTIGVFPQFQAQTPTVLQVRERKLSVKGDDFK